MGFWNWEVQASNPGLECLSPVFSHWVQKAKDVGLTEANQETSMTPISKIQQYGIETTIKMQRFRMSTKNFLYTQESLNTIKAGKNPNFLLNNLDAMSILAAQ